MRKRFDHRPYVPAGCPEVRSVFHTCHHKLWAHSPVAPRTQFCAALHGTYANLGTRTNPSKTPKGPSLARRNERAIQPEWWEGLQSLEHWGAWSKESEKSTRPRAFKFEDCYYSGVSKYCPLRLALVLDRQQIRNNHGTGLVCRQVCMKVFR